MAGSPNRPHRSIRPLLPAISSPRPRRHATLEPLTIECDDSLARNPEEILDPRTCTMRDHAVGDKTGDAYQGRSGPERGAGVH